VNLTTGATLNLAFAGNDTVKQLRIDGVVQSPGTWGSPASAAAHKTALDRRQRRADGRQRRAQPPYASWIASYSVTGADSAPGADPDHDGAIKPRRIRFQGGAERSFEAGPACRVRPALQPPDRE